MFKPYPKKSDTPSRKSRKSERGRIFLGNKLALRKVAKERWLARQPEVTEEYDS